MPSFASRVLKQAAFSLLKTQFLMGLSLAFIYLLLSGLAMFLASLYGLMIALIVSIQSAWKIYQASNNNKKQVVYVQIYRGLIQKYLLALLLFALGLGGLKLAPLPLLSTFALAQLGYVYNRVETNYNKVK